MWVFIFIFVCLFVVEGLFWVFFGFFFFFFFWGGGGWGGGRSYIYLICKRKKKRTNLQLKVGLIYKL